MRRLIPYLTALAVALVAIAIYQYPGGSSFDKNHQGYSLLHNYWCDLLDTTAHNGQLNQGKYFAVFAGILACVALYGVMAELSRNFLTKPGYANLAQTAAALSMVAATLLFTPWHNFFVTLLIGGFAVYFSMLYKPIWGHAGNLGKYIITFTLLLLVATAFIYYTGWGLTTLPWVQKIAFLLLLILFRYLYMRTPANP